MTKVSSTIEATIRATFSPEEATIVLTAFSEMEDPPSDKEWVITRARVQAAILISAQSDLEKLLKRVASSQIDWRDTLMNGGLGESNWRSIAKGAGFDIS